MVMIAGSLRKSAEPQRAELGPSDAALVGKTELVYVYDYNPITEAGTTWRARVPLADLMDHLPITCRSTPNIRALRYWGVLAGVLLGTAAVSGLFYPIFSYYAAIMGFLFGAAPGALIGWVGAPHIPSFMFFEAPKPFWVVRRVWQQGAQVDAEAAVAFAEAAVEKAKDKTKARIAVEEAEAAAEAALDSYNLEDSALFAQFNEGWRRYVMPITFNFLADGAYITGDGTALDISQSHELVSNKPGPRNGHTPQTELFLPVVHRATSLYENLLMRVYKAMHRRSLTGWQKVQIASVAVLAGVALAALIFVVIVTSDEQTKASFNPSNSSVVQKV